MKRLSPILLLSLFSMAILILSARMEPFEGMYAKTELKAETAKEMGRQELVVPKDHLICQYYDQKDFYQSLGSAKASQEIPPSEVIQGGIVTHHLLASDLIAEFFVSIAHAKPKTIFIIGPNHKRYGSSKIHTGKWSWETDLGLLDVDLEAEEQILNEMNAKEDFELLEREHSISALIPYVRYYFPESKIVPILIHGNLEMDECARLTNTLVSVFEKKECLLIASIDFSHYLPPEKAYEMDAATIESIKARDLPAVKRMGNDNLDAPPTLVSTLMLMDRLGTSRDYLIRHTNSSDILGTWIESTTSYLSYVFTK